jgi:hypothetical protein
VAVVVNLKTDSQAKWVDPAVVVQVAVALLLEDMVQELLVKVILAAVVVLARTTVAVAVAEPGSGVKMVLADIHLASAETVPCMQFLDHLCFMVVAEVAVLTCQILDISLKAVEEVAVTVVTQAAAALVQPEPTG